MSAALPTGSVIGILGGGQWSECGLKGGMLGGSQLAKQRREEAENTRKYRTEKEDRD